MPATGLPPRYGAPRAFGTAIYYLLTADDLSALHRVASDEVFHHYAGDAVDMVQIGDGGQAVRMTLGPDLEAGERPQVVVPAGTWQGARVQPGGSWALMGCTVTPGFSFDDFEMADARTLEEAFPDLAAEIALFTRP